MGSDYMHYQVISAYFLSRYLRELDFQKGLLHLDGAHWSPIGCHDSRDLLTLVWACRCGRFLDSTLSRYVRSTGRYSKRTEDVIDRRGGCSCQVTSRGDYDLLGFCMSFVLVNAAVSPWDILPRIGGDSCSISHPEDGRR